MVKKWRSCLSLLVSFAFILSMLFLDTLEVNAWNLNDVLYRRVFQSGTPSNPVEIFTSKKFYHSDNFDSSDNQYFQYEGDYAFNFVLMTGQDSSSIEIDPKAYYYIDLDITQLEQWWTYYVSTTSTTETTTNYLMNGNWRLTLQNFYFTDASGNVVGTTWQSSDGIWKFGYFIKGRELVNGWTSSNQTLGIPLTIHVSGYWKEGEHPGTATGPTYVSYLYFKPHYWFTIYSLRDEYKYSINDTAVSDTIVQQQMDDLNSSTDAIEESTTNPNGTGILGTIKNFFGGFFGWLHDTILGLFVPSSDYFTTWFTNVNTLLSDKLGMLYAPLDLLISTLNAVYSASSDFSGVPFPEIKWGDTVLVSSQNLTFSNLLGEHFEDIQGYVYFGTDVVLLFAFLMLLQRKITLVLRGHESG